jgi:ABC-type Fe3+-hydroxamate transport system substrate-binding protein
MQSTIKIIDQMKREVVLPAFPLRIVSLVPSQTELLFDLGLGERVVGITKFCVHPKEWFDIKPRVGGTKRVDFEKIAALKPDLIIGNKEENSKEDVEALEKDYPVWMSDIYTFEDALEMIFEVSGFTNSEEKGIEILKAISAAKDAFKEPIDLKKAVYFIWNKPYMVVGKNTFIDDILYHAGYVNVVMADRYLELSIENLKTLDTEVVLLSSEPFPFKKKHLDALKKHLPEVEIKIVDGEMFSWYGSRLTKSFPYFASLNTTL